MLGTRRYAALATAVLALAAFNLTFRLGNESLTEWDGSLYATSALEMIESGDWVVTTLDGTPDYYNSKPPLNVWLIALSLHTFGASLVSVRLASVLSAWLTVLVLLIWSRRRFGPGVGLFASLVLATSFGFLHVHSGRTGNPDAPLALLLSLVVMTLDLARERPWRRVWLGPLLAGVFFVKGMAVLWPLLLIAIVETRQRLDVRDRWRPLALAGVIGALPVAGWAAARWRVDGSLFFERLFFQDFVDLTTRTLEGHSGSPLFYLNILVKHHYDWIVAALAAVILFTPASWAPVRHALAFWRHHDHKALLGFWAAVAFVVPTLMSTKLPWYLNPFYPLFALGVGWVINYGFSRGGGPSHHKGLLVAMVVMASVVAEAKLVWYSYSYRAIENTVQGLLLVEADRIRGTRVFGSSWDNAEAFVLKGLVRADRADVMTVDEFLRLAGPGDHLVMPAEIEHPELVRVSVYGGNALYRRRD